MGTFTINRVPKGKLLPPNNSYSAYTAKRGKLTVADVLQRKGIDVNAIQGTSPDVSAMQTQIDTQGQVIDQLKDDIEELKLVINTLSTLEDFSKLPKPLDLDDCPLGADDTSGNDFGDPAEYDEREPDDGYNPTRTKAGDIMTIDNVLADKARLYGSTTPGNVAQALGMPEEAGITLGGEIEDAGWERDGDINSIDTVYRCDDLGAHLEYNQGLRQVYRGVKQVSYTKPDGSRGYLRTVDAPDSHYFEVAAWLSREAWHRGEHGKANKYAKIAISGGISLNEVRFDG